jgi:hypothetical protein
MRLRPWFIFSVGLNLILVAAWYIAHIQEDHFPQVPAPRFDFTARSVRTNSIVRYVNITWDQIESTNLGAYMTNLIAVGCPPATIRDLILAQVNKTYSRRRATEVLTPDQQWWRTEQDPGVAPAANAQLRALESERRALLDSLLGTDWTTETDVAAWLESNYGLTGPHLGTLPPSVKRMLYDLADRTQAELAGENPADAARTLQAERLKLQNWLTPVALTEYLLRYSPTATQLRNDTRGVNFSPDQFQSLFAAIDPILLQPDYYYRGDDPALSKRQRDLQAQYEADLRAALGEDTYRALRLNQDPLYVSIASAAQQAGVPGEAIARLYQINQMTQTELNRIRYDTNLSSDDKITALASTRTEQQQAIQQLIGTNAFQRWLQTQSNP